MHAELCDYSRHCGPHCHFEIPLSRLKQKHLQSETELKQCLCVPTNPTKNYRQFVGETEIEICRWWWWGWGVVAQN